MYMIMSSCICVTILVDLEVREVLVSYLIIFWSRNSIFFLRIISEYVPQQKARIIHYILFPRSNLSVIYNYKNLLFLHPFSLVLVDAIINIYISQIKYKANNFGACFNYIIINKHYDLPIIKSIINFDLEKFDKINYLVGMTKNYLYPNGSCNICQSYLVDMGKLWCELLFDYHNLVTRVLTTFDL
jgi:hypothetical protein